MPKRWRISTHDVARVSALGRAAGVPPVVAQLLICRGISDPQVVRDFLEPKLSDLREPDELPGASEAARILHEGIRAGRRVTVYGDYDADGMTAAAILLLVLRLLGAKADFYIPNRIDEGYGINHDALRTISERGGDIVITVDCGISSVAEAETAAQLGLTLIVTDHHRPAADSGGCTDLPIEEEGAGEAIFAPKGQGAAPRPSPLPRAAAIVHPALPGSTYSFAGLCGAGVALKVAWALCQLACGSNRVSDAMRSFLMRAVGLAAIGTIADVVPLVEENRILVRHGLNCLRHWPSAGLVALEELTGLDKKPVLDCEDIGFTIAPRLNAAGRLGQAALALELLITDSPERARQLAEFISTLNEQRQSLERSVHRAATQQLNELCDPSTTPAIVLAGRGWHPGVIGIVAGRLADQYHRPTILISLDELGCKPGTGSGRSVAGFNLHAALAECGMHLLSHGGHAAAAGLTIDETSVTAFRSVFCACAEQNIAAEDRVAELVLDAETPLSAITQQTVRQIESLAPFGPGNRRPMLCATDVSLVEPPKRIGAGGHHLSMRLSQHGINIRGVAFGGGEWEERLCSLNQPFSIAFRPVINEYRGRRSVEIHIADWRCIDAE